MSAGPRAWHGRAEALLLTAGALAAALGVFGLFVWFGGGSPLDAWGLLFRGAFGDAVSWQNSLQRAAPLMLTALVLGALGYTGILVSFVARHNPWAIPPVALLFGGFAAAGSLLQRRMGLPDASVLVLQGFAFVFILAAEALRGRLFQLQMPALVRLRLVPGRASA